MPISIVLPMLDEADGIAETIRSLQDVQPLLDNDEVEIIVVDDGSTDNGALIAEELGAIVVRHLTTLGYGRSLKDGILAARHETIAICDADGTYPVSALPELYREYKKGYDLVVGARAGRHYIESRKKEILRFILRFLVEFTAGSSIPDINSGLRIFSKQTIVPYFDRLSDTFSFTTSQTLAYFMRKKFIKYVPIAYEKRVGKTKVKLFRDALRTLQFIIEAILYYNPIKIYLILVAATLLLSLGCFLAGWLLGIESAFVLAVIGVLVGISLFGLGLISILLSRILQKLS